MTSFSEYSLFDPNLPYLTESIQAVGGDIKTIPADFFVEELPLYECTGHGTHTYAFIQKKNMTTLDLISCIGRELGVHKMNIGYAGRKDARAITRQWISIEHIDPKRLKKIETRNIKILDVRQHTNKLKIGHLKGNRFVIRLRNLDVPMEQAVLTAGQILDTLSVKGVPNYFGRQRFGYRGDSHLLGYAVVKNDVKAFFDILLGKPELDPNDEFHKARTFYEQGDYEAALYEWNTAFGDYRKALKILVRFDGDYKRAFKEYDRRMINLVVAAWQSDLFNCVLTKRMPDIDVMLDGDMAYKHVNGACFLVEDAAAEQPRCTTFEISPTGPLVGNRMQVLAGPAGEIENAVLDTLDLHEDDYKRMQKHRAVGGRRPLRFKPENIKVAGGNDEHGPYLELHFDLPSGCYATVLLREITKQKI